MTIQHPWIIVALIIVPAAQLAAQPAGRPTPRLASFSFLLRKPEFRKDLELLDEQQAELQSIYSERNKLLASDPAEMSPEDRRIHFETFQARQAELEKRAENVLLPHQMRRFEQIQLQNLMDAPGPTAGLMHPQMVEKVKLSASQIEKVKATADATNAKLKEKIAQLEAEIKQARNDARRTILSELTDEQRRIYHEAFGEIVEYNLR